MAVQTTVTTTDDIDGGRRDVRTVQFSLDGIEYTIDLSKKNATALTKALEPFISNARRISAPRASRSTQATRSPLSLAEIRAWAQEQGLQVAARGRISDSVRAAYAEAH